MNKKNYLSKFEEERKWLGPDEEFSERQLEHFENFTRELVEVACRIKADEGLYNGTPLIDNLKIGEAIEKIILVATKSPACGGWGISTDDL
jgi:hypothetical protein